MPISAEKVAEDSTEEVEIPTWMRETILERYHQSVANPSRGKPLDLAHADAKAKFKARHDY